MPKRVGPYWTDARFALEVHEAGATAPRLVPLGRPFALIGRIAHADLHIDDRDVSARHVYIHADAPGSSPSTWRRGPAPGSASPRPPAAGSAPASRSRSPGG